MSTIDTLTSALSAGHSNTTAIRNISMQISAVANDPGASVSDIVAAVRAVGISKSQLDGVLKNIMTGSGGWESAKIGVRGRLTSVISEIIASPDAFAPPAAAPTPPPTARHPFEVPATIMPIPPEPPKATPGIKLLPQDVANLTSTDKKYIAAFEKAGIAADLTGASDSVSASAMQEMIAVASSTPGLSLRDFLIEVVVGSQTLHFAGVSTNPFSNAAAVLVAAADRQKTAAEAANNEADVEKLQKLMAGVIGAGRRSKATIASIYGAVDAIHAADSTAAAPGLRAQLTANNVGGSLKGRYDFHLSHDASVLVADPHIEERPRAVMRGASRGGVVSQKSEIGGRALQLVGDTFAKGHWEQKTLADLVSADPRFAEEAGRWKFDMYAPRDVLVVEGKEDPHPIYLVFSQAGDGVLTICKDCAFHQFDMPGQSPGSGAPIMVRKPVIYVYPTTAMTVRIQLEVAGKYVAQYPKMNRADGWEVRAQPNGDLLDPKTEKTYAYLFWEAERAEPFTIDESKASLVARENVVEFLDKMAAAYQLTARERTDFVSYWMAPMQANAYSMVQFLDEEYERYAAMRVSPEPESVIRLFMIFKSATGMERVGNPSLPKVERRGFTVVEWGGANLDERVGK